ncbi:hypothetical protein [Methyloceanibacter stevinii]|uniref:hypothetical protein n=1 Tax=Methyloceanibacter stevinii TaxID=1774970 RepID=UPI000A560B0A|nr:hypothetical protein [Methyloceanibacter stevinii]
MTALTKGRNTPLVAGDVRALAVAAATVLFQGGIAMRNAAGYATKGATALNLVGIGRIEEEVDNASGANGDLSVRIRPGIFLYENSEGGDEIAIADIGKVAYVVDDQTVAKTDGTSTRSRPASFTTWTPMAVSGSSSTKPSCAPISASGAERNSTRC